MKDTDATSPCPGTPNEHRGNSDCAVGDCHQHLSCHPLKLSTSTSASPEFTICIPIDISATYATEIVEDAL